MTWGDRPYDRYGRHARAERDRLLLPEPYWLADEGGWVKSLLLFFDEIAILLPEYMRGRLTKALDLAMVAKGRFSGKAQTQFGEVSDANLNVIYTEDTRPYTL